MTEQITHLVSGLHHVTAIASSAQTNYDFYHGVLGLRLVKQTVNFDDPTSYHLYYGDDNATPGTLITFFTWPHLPKQTHGAGEIACVGFAIPINSFDFWKQRLNHKKIKFFEGVRGGFTVLALSDYDGMQVELVGVKHARDLRAKNTEVPLEHAICGIEYVVLNIANLTLVAEVLETLGYTHTNNHGDVHQFTRVHDHFFVKEVPAGSHDAIQGIGAVHHVAVAVANDDDELVVRAKVRDLGHHATAQIDRTYFHSVYFREHNAILFEIATNRPGFTVDESRDSLGTTLCLPPQYAKHRKEIVANLPPFKV